MSAAVISQLTPMIEWAEAFTWETEPLVHSGWTIPVATVVFYFVVVVQLLPRYMATREAFKLKTFLSVWNFGLFLFSLGCILSFVWRLVLGVQQHGLDVLICDTNGHFWSGLDLFCVWIFLISKFFELGDTVLLVLRKRPVIFLHWYHHVTVLLYCWQANMTHNSNSILFGTMNAFIHTVMYYYYWQSSMGNRLSWGSLVTKLQLSQMFFGIALVVSWGYYDRVLDMNCYATTHDGPLLTSFIMYGSYFILFLHFYVGRWLAKRKSDKEGKSD
eukprot:TRINITY_DN3926_c0_g1_i1.p1 TRINITY_DN3926_c0_g1~~TRINITY_DN3926_c0_g1_i1.p1  ORF type:complete len:273 (+),score=40.39 TRINITY_DN3926_c0_g1_i1:32-850(+)